MDCQFCYSRIEIERLLNEGHCDEEVRQKIKTLELGNVTYEQNLREVDRGFMQWRTKPICLPSYTYNGKRRRPDWSEEGQQAEIREGFRLKTKECMGVIDEYFFKKPHGELAELSRNLSQVFGCLTNQQRKDFGDSFFKEINYQNLQMTVANFCERKVQEYVEYTYSEELGFLNNVKGSRAEELVKEYLLKKELSSRPGLIVLNLEALSHLQPYLEAYKIRGDCSAVETDIIMVKPNSSGTIKVTFGEVKAFGGDHSTTYFNMKLEQNISKAMNQLQKDIKIFNRLFSFLREIDWEKIEMRALCYLPHVSERTDIHLCQKCKIFIAFEEQITYPDESINHEEIDEETMKLYLKILGLFAGPTCTMQNKTIEDGYRSEQQDLHNISMFKYKNSDVGSASGMYRMNPDNYHNRTRGTILTGPYGCGKTITLLSLCRQTIMEKCTDSDMVIFIIYKSHAQELKTYIESQILNNYMIQHLNLSLSILDRDEALTNYHVPYDCETTSQEINTLFENIVQEEKKRQINNIFVFMDEVEIKVNHQPLLGNAPFVLNNGLIAEWSNLCFSDQLYPVISVAPKSQCFLEREQNNSVEAILENNTWSQVSTRCYEKVYRSNQKIHEFIKLIKKFSCESFNMDPDLEKHGHEIPGQKPLWFTLRSKPHLLCSRLACRDCFLRNEQLMSRIVNIDTKLGVSMSDIVVIFQEPGSYIEADRCAQIKSFFEDRTGISRLKCNQEYEGMEADCVILIQNRGNIEESLSSGLSRAKSRLVVFSPLDQQLDEAVYEANQRNLVLNKRFSLFTFHTFVSRLMLTKIS